MSQRQLALKLVFSNSRRNLKIETLNYARSKEPPGTCSISPSLLKKIERLADERPAAARVVERLVDDMLAGGSFYQNCEDP